MNQIIKKQLEQVKVADLSNFDEKTHTFTIPKYNQVRLVEDESYIIKLDPTLLKPNPGDTFHINWNKGQLPTSEYMTVEVSQVNGKVVKVYGLGYNIETEQSTTDVWNGWLPIEKLTVVRSL